MTGKCIHCDEQPAGAEGTIWCADCLGWWRNKYEIDCLVDNVDDRTIPHHVIVPVKSWERIREMIGYPLPEATKGIVKDGK